jgi:hypothetical protein
MLFVLPDPSTPVSDPATKRLAAMECCVSTVARPQKYIYQLLDCLLPWRHCRLVVGSPDAAYLDRYRGNSSAEIIIPSEEEWNPVKVLSVHRRAAWNYWRSLEAGQADPLQGGLLLLEDDVILARQWQIRLVQTVIALESRLGSLFILALFTSHKLNFSWGPAAPLFVEYPGYKFCGTPAMYYPEPVRSQFSWFLKRFGVDQFNGPYDLILQDFIQERNIPLLACNPNLAQHVGLESTILGTFCRTEYFLDDRPAPPDCSYEASPG